jgi:hypothetical protein
MTNMSNYIYHHRKDGGKSYFQFFYDIFENILKGIKNEFLQDESEIVESCHNALYSNDFFIYKYDDHKIRRVISVLENYLSKLKAEFDKFPDDYSPVARSNRHDTIYEVSRLIQSLKDEIDGR